MSNWSSFKSDKKHMDDWRTFLTESKSPQKIEEIEWFGAKKRREKAALGTDKKLADGRWLGPLDRWVAKTKNVDKARLKKYRKDFLEGKYVASWANWAKVMRQSDIDIDELLEWIHWRFEKGFSGEEIQKIEKLRTERDARPEEAEEETQKEFEENPENFKSPDLASLSQYEREEAEEEEETADAEEEETSAADPDAPQPESGQASVRVGQMTRNLAGHLMTMDQANFIQGMVLRALNQAGYGNAIRMDESTKLLKQFLTDPAVLLKELLIADIITEITATGRGYDPGPRRTPARTSRALAPIDLGGAGIKPENQRKVKNLLDKMLAGVGLEVAFGPTKPDPRFATSGAEPEAAAAAAEPEAPAAEPEAAAAQDIKISTSSRYGKATSFEDIAAQLLGLSGLPDPNKDRENNRKVKQLTAKITQVMKKALQNEFGASLGKVTIYENNQAKIEKLFIEEFQRVLNEKR